MSIIHFLNVGEGDCTWIHHASGHVTVIDISAAICSPILESTYGNYHQKNFPVNPIEYLKVFGVSSIFRFILTHPDMDHMDGIKALFENFEILNFWDTENKKIMEEGCSWGKYKKEDWEFYQKIRTSTEAPTVLHLYAGVHGQYYNIDESGKSGADGLYILAPTKELVAGANDSGDYNDCSYVILYKTENKKIVFAGDSAEKTWNYILDNHMDDVTDVDILLAPHHGRKTGGNSDYLDVLKPKPTLFGNAKSEYLDYGAWNRRGLAFITNNQANCIIMKIGKDGIHIYVTYETFAKKENPFTFYDESLRAWYIRAV